MNLQLHKLTVKAKLLAIILIGFALQTTAQDNPITSITISLPSNPDANVANWGTGTSTFVITATAHMVNGRIDPVIEESRILVIIKKDGKKFLGSYTGSNAPAAEFNAPTKVWSGRNAAALLGQDGALQPGDYELSVQFFGIGAASKPVPLSDEKTKPFTIKGNDQQAYQPPQGISPATGTEFKNDDIKKPIIFRWTPVIPKPQEPVTYRLKIWQLMQGQTGTQAMRVNQPIITKDVDNLTQAVITNLITGPCLPPYLCEFVWNVQALNREGKPIGGNNGTSELFTFKYENETLTAVPDGKDTAAAIYNGCPRHVVTWVNIAAELGRVSTCAVPVNKCTAYDQRSTSETHYLWQGPASHSFTLSEQNTIITQAKQWAQSNRPACSDGTLKSVIAINFLKDVIVGNENSNNVVGITVQYGCCTGVMGPATQRDAIISDDTNRLPIVNLISPVAELKQGDTRPTFNWTVSNPVKGQVSAIKITEIIGPQSPEEALKANTPVLDVKGIKDTAFTYPSSAKRIDTGKLYAWNVTITGNEGKQSASSAPALFALPGNAAQMQNLFCPFSVSTIGTLNVCQGAGLLNFNLAASAAGYWFQIANSGGAIYTGYGSSPSQPVSLTVPTLPGTYTYTLTATKPVFNPFLHFCTVTVPFTINVLPLLSASINKIEICNGQDAQLSVVNLPAGYTANWKWRDGQGAWNQMGTGNPMNTNAITTSCNSGQNYVTREFQATITGTPVWPAACQQVSAFIKIWCPASAGNITPVPNICASNYPVSFPLTLNGPYVATSYAWSYTGPAGATFTSPNTLNPGSFHVVTDGVYHIMVTITNGTCSPITRSITVTIERPLTAQITGNKTEVCPNDDANLYVSAQPAGTIIQWEYQINSTGPWLPTAVTGGTQNTNAIGNLGPYVPAPTTSISWRVIVSSSTGICPPVTSSPYQINIIQPPCTPVISGGPLPKCPGSPVTLTATTSCGTGPFTWQWYLNGLPAGTGSSIAAVLPGNYTVEVFNKNQCDSKVSAPFKVVDCVTLVNIAGPCNSNGSTAVTLTASANSQSNPAVSPNPGCGGPYTYSWTSQPSIAISNPNAATITATPTVTTVFTVTVTSGNGSAADCVTTASFTVKVCQ